MSAAESNAHDKFALPQAGETLGGKYRIERMIGQGGMGAVYVAQHEILHQPVAIKLLLPEIAENQEAVARFLNEARAAARIRNEHVAQVMDVGRLDNGSAYMVLEFLDGFDLGEMLEREGAQPIEQSVDYVLQALEAVAQAHALGIIHRDLKPANLFVAKRQDGSPMIKVLDFGISKATNPLTQAANSAVTSTKALLGSPGYMSPEQVRSSKHVDARTDIWSIGVILYRLLTNHTPFDGDNLGAVFAAILEETPASIRSLRPEIPEGLELVVSRCLERDRAARWANCAELAQALATFASAEGALAADRVCRTLAVTPSRLTRTSKPNQTGGVGGEKVAESSQSSRRASMTNEEVHAKTAHSDAPKAGEAGAQASTAASWSESKPPTTQPRKRRGLVIGAVAAVVVAGAAIVGVKMLGGGDRSPNEAARAGEPRQGVAAQQPATQAVELPTTKATEQPAPPPATTTQPPSSATHEPDPAPTQVASASASPATSAKPTPPVPTGKAAAIPTHQKAPPATTTTTTKTAAPPEDVLLNRK